ncbi:MAG: SixA phosphatase family protein [Chloroflexota bacterium]
MDLVIVRHAIAEQRDPRSWPDDAQRPLSSKGVKRFKKAAKGLGKLAPGVDNMLSSPYERAWQTAELLETHAGWGEPEVLDALGAGNTPGEVMDALAGRRLGQRVALVGHEPIMGELVTVLIGGPLTTSRAQMKKGGAALVHVPGDRVEAGAGLLAWLHTPKALRALG